MPTSISEPDVKHLAQDAGQKESNKCETARSRRVSFAVFTIAAFIIMICGSVLLFKLGGIYAEIKGELLNGCASRALFSNTLPAQSALYRIKLAAAQTDIFFLASLAYALVFLLFFLRTAFFVLVRQRYTEHRVPGLAQPSRSIFSSVPGVRIYTSVCVIPAARSSSIRLAKDTPLRSRILAMLRSISVR